MEVEQTNTAMLPTGDFERLSKHEREEFHALQERIVARLIQESNHFRTQFPGLRVDWRFQLEVYQDVQNTPSTIHYSNRVF